MHRYADEVSVFLLGHRGEPLGGVEAAQVDHLVALPDEELTDRHRTDLVLVEAEGTNDDASRALAPRHGRVPAGRRRAAYSKGSPGSPWPSRRQLVISPMVASASSAAMIGAMRSAAGSAAASRTRSRPARSGASRREARQARIRSTCA